jgi:NAD(P)-dependent dehydrogenase (short-subunit alcohol dehydrogenase family)
MAGLRMEGKQVVVVGAGQMEGETIGNGRAMSLLFAREGATVLCVDRRLDSAEETVAMVAAEGGTASALRADITDEDDCRAIVSGALERLGRIDALVNNVGIGDGDNGAVQLAAEAWDRILDVNLKGMWMTCKHALPVLMQQGAGAIVNISSVAATCSAPFLAYKVSKAGVNALTQQLAMTGAGKGVRVNAVMPGLMDTPMAIETMVREIGIEREQLRAIRNSLVPLGQQMGTAWDVAHAVLYLASDEARFVTGAILPVDGGQQARVGG